MKIQEMKERYFQSLLCEIKKSEPFDSEEHSGSIFVDFDDNRVYCTPGWEMSEVPHDNNVKIFFESVIDGGEYQPTTTTHEVDFVITFNLAHDLSTYKTLFGEATIILNV